MQFERQEHQEQCVKNIMQAVESSERDTLTIHVLHNKLQDPKPEDNRLDILMETGTGKTLAYLETIFEMNKRFGKKRFLIISPRRAIKLGIIQQINQSKEYFYGIYKKYLNFVNYPDDGIDSVSQDFLEKNGPSILLITNSAFNSEKKKINASPEGTLFGKRKSIWDEIVHQKPVVIIDEPHQLKGEKTTKYLDELKGQDNSLFLRFGATYPDIAEHKLSNIVYTLDSITALQNHLVKEIGVSTIEHPDEIDDIQIVKLISGKSFGVSYQVNQQSKRMNIKMHDDLGSKTGISQYYGVTATKITSKEVTLSNGRKFREAEYEINTNEARLMIHETIRLHFEEEERLFMEGVKSLSLFFIPRVDDFRGDSPRIKNMFEEEYRRIRKQYYDKTTNNEYRKYLDRDYNNGKLQIHEGYFADDGKTKDEQEVKGVNLILNEKEKLLSFDTPLRFIFSVWALQEGWDNPNIFNICKLTNSGKEISRRQQVGRGLRVAVNQNGIRQTYDRLAKANRNFSEINRLNVIVSSHERDFIKQIQEEIQNNSNVVGDIINLTDLQEHGLSDFEASLIFIKLKEKKVIDSDGKLLRPVYDFLKAHREDLFSSIDDECFDKICRMFRTTSGKVIDINKIKPVRIRTEKWEEFRELWEVINRRAKITYKGIDEDEIIDRVSELFNKEEFEPVIGKIYRDFYDAKNDRIVRKVGTYESSSFFETRTFEEFIMNLTKEIDVPLRFMLKLVSKLNRKQFECNPERAQNSLKKLILDAIHNMILRKIDYNFSETTIYGNALQTESGTPKESIPHTNLGKYHYNELPPDNFLYDRIVYDSTIELECIKSDPERVDNNTVTVFAKLPKINIPTPYKTYNPDFAYMIYNENGKKIFLVVETKGYDSKLEIPENQQTKINYAKKFFVTLQKILPKSITIRYVSRTNKTELANIIKEIKHDLA